MKKLIATGATILLFVFIIQYLRAPVPSSQVAGEIDLGSPSVTSAKETATPPVREPAASVPEPSRPLASNAGKTPNVPKPADSSLEAMGHTLGQIGQPAFSLKGLLEDLQRTGQQPLVVRDDNPDSGEMLIVRTKSPLPGTRYFHAQYFTDESGDRFVQHMSFEFKPGADSMSEAIASVERNFAGLSRPVVQRADYVKWKLDNHYIVWVKKMAAADLQEDPFNSYSLSDDGTIRVAVELEIHGE